MRRRFVGVVTAAFMLAGHVCAQLSLDINLRSPMPSLLSQWRVDPTILQASIRNAGGTAYRGVGISFTVTVIFAEGLADGVVAARSRDDSGELPRFDIDPGQNIVRTTPELYNPRAITLDPAIQGDVTSTQMLPEGTYEICVRLMDAAGNELATSGINCATFGVLNPDPPTLLLPEEGTVFTAAGPLPTFNWTPVVLSAGHQARYKLRICAILDGQTPRDAIEGPNSLREIILTTMPYIYLPSDPSFELFPQTHHFAWQVQAVDDNGWPMPLRNEGKSEIFSFAYRPATDCGHDCLCLGAGYPRDNADNIPVPPQAGASFSIEFRPHINRQGIRLGTIRVWLRPDQESIQTTIARNPDFTGTFDGGTMDLEGGFANNPDLMIYTVVPLDANAMPLQRQEAKNYVWTVDLEFDDATLLADGTRCGTDRAQGGPWSFRTLGGGISDSTIRCVIVQAISPANQTPHVPLSTRSFSIGFDREINTDAVTGGTIKLWVRQGLEGDEVTMARIPYFTGTFAAADLQAAGRSAELWQYNITPLNSGGAQMQLQSLQQYLWTVDVRYDPARIRRDGSACNTPLAPGGPYFFGSEEGCSNPCFCIEAATPYNNADRILPSLMTFSIAVSSQINRNAVTQGRVQLWLRQGEEGHGVTMARAPAFVGTFTGASMEQVGDSGNPWIYRVTPITDLGAPAQLQPLQQYLWTVDIDYDGTSILQGGTACNSSHSSGGPFFFRTSESCSNACTCIEALSPRDNANNAPPGLEEFSFGFRPHIKINMLSEVVTGGTLRVWRRNAGESLENTIMRNPDFTGEFLGSNLDAEEDRDGMSVVSLEPHDRNGNAIRLQAGSNYAWTVDVNYDRFSVRRDNTVCDVSSTSGGPFLFTAETDQPCADDCTSPAPANLIPSVRSFAAGDVLQVGRFQATLTSASGTGAGLSGEGTIRVPFLRAPIIVEFSNVQVNTENQVYGGELTGRQDGGSPLTPAQANQLSNDLGLSQDAINAVGTYIADMSRWVTGLSGLAPVGLPLGLDNTIAGERVTLAIIGLVFTPTRAAMNVVLAIPMPDLGPGVGLGLGARDICIHPNGFGGDGRFTLYLPNDHGWRQDDSSTFGLVFKGVAEHDSGTYARWDCHGIREIRLSMEASFPRSWFTPFPDDGSSRVKSRFTTVVTWETRSDWIAGVSLDRCYITGLPEFIMEAREMYYDHSDVRNPEGMVFPAGFVGQQDRLWRGFYLKRASFSFPRDIHTFDSDAPITFAAVDFIIGGGGFTGSCRAENLLRYPEGMFGSWGGSLDTFAIDFLNSSVRDVLMKGRILLPVSDGPIDYSARLFPPQGGHGTQWEFLLQPRDTLNIPMWGPATLALYPTSRIAIHPTDAGHLDTAKLSGELTLLGSAGGIPGLNFSGIAFQNFELTNSPPYVNAGTWSFASPQHGMAGFPVTINGMGVVTEDRDGDPGVGLRFTLAVNLQPGNNAISGATTLSIWGKLSGDGGPQRFMYDGVNLDSIGVDADLGAVQIAGGVRLYRSDPTFGDGFRGGVRATFARQVTVEATLQFGTVSGYRYWYVDAKAGFTPGIPVFTGVGIYGFGGGAWYHMRRSGADATVSADPSTSRTDTSLTPGTSNSGYSYVPDDGTSFGFRAMVILGTHPSADAFNADVAFEAEFLAGGGISRIGIIGHGYMMAGINNRDEAKVTADVDIEYDFPGSTFHGVFDVDINASPFTGGGQMVMHIDPSLWYIKIGEPASRVNLNLANWFTIDAYLMMGQQLPPPPSLPPEVSSILGELPVSRNPALGTADGFAFGASAEISTGRQEFLIFYGYISAGVGFDIALLNFGPGTTCEGGNGTIGLNGWYAMGQLYAYIEASVGLHVDVWFTEGDFEILGISAAAALQAGAPNPTWVAGAVGGHYSILGGLVHGRCRFEFKLGEECRPVVENPLARLDIISDIKPDNGATGVDVTVEPQAAFNFDIDRSFEIRELAAEGQGRVRTFRMKVRDFTLEKTNNHGAIPGAWRLSADAVQATFSPHDMLSGNTRHTATITAYGEEYINNAWSQARRRDGTSIEQSATTTFRAGNEPDKILESNIAYTYPLDRQRFFLQNECRGGTVALRTGQPRLFDTSGAPAGYRIKLLARFIPAHGGAEITSPITYNNAARMVEFNIPTLLNSTPYVVQIVRKEELIPAPGAGAGARVAIPAGINPLQGQITAMTTLHERFSRLVQGVNVTVTARERNLPGTQVRTGERLLYVFYFKTSRYNSLSAKLNNLTPAAATVSRWGNIETMKMRLTGEEYFDVYDMHGKSFTRDGWPWRIGPLVQLQAAFRTSRWHTQFANPWIYDAIERFRSLGHWGEEVYFDRMASQIDGTYLAEYTNHPEPLINDLEILPPLPAGGGGLRAAIGEAGFGGFDGNRLFGGAAAPILETAISVDYMHGGVAPLDFVTVRNFAARVMASGVYRMDLSRSCLACKSCCKGLRADVSGCIQVGIHIRF